MRYPAAADHSARTIRSYCYASLTWFRILWMLDVAWDRATLAETAALVGWLRIAPNPVLASTLKDLQPPTGAGWLRKPEPGIRV